MNQKQLPEVTSTVRVDFEGCFYAARHMFGEPVKAFTKAIEDDNKLLNARVVRFSGTIEPPRSVTEILSRRSPVPSPVINIVTSCFGEKQDASSKKESGKKVLMWVEGLKVERNEMNQFLGMIVENPKSAIFRETTATERKKYQISAHRIFSVPNAWFLPLDPFGLEHFTVLDRRVDSGLQITCRVKAAEALKGRPDEIFALGEVEISEAEFRKGGYEFAYRLGGRGCFGIRYKSSHPSYTKRFSGSELIRAAIPMFVGIMPAKVAV